MITVLLVLFVLNGEASTFAVKTNGLDECIAMQAQITVMLPKLIGTPPQFIATACAEVKPFLTDV